MAKINKMSLGGKTKIGLALGSGGARGLAHIGVLRVLEREKIPVDLIVGSSMGSLIGGLYASGMNVDNLEEIALNIKWQYTAKFFTPTISKAGLVDGNKIEKLLETFIGKIIFSKLKIPFVTVTTDIENGKEILIKTGKVSRAIRASCSIPGIFTPLKYGNRYLVDGGLVNPVPVEVARRSGANIVIGVNVIPEVVYKREESPVIKFESILKNRDVLGLNKGKITSKIINTRMAKFIEKKINNTGIKQSLLKIFMEKKKTKEKHKMPSIFNVLMQAIFIMEREIAKMKLKEADIGIETEFSRRINPMQYYRAAECILEGEKATEKVLPLIRKIISKIPARQK